MDAQQFENIIEQAEAEKEQAERIDIERYFLDFTRDIPRPTTVIYDALDPDKIVVTEQNIFTIAGEAKSYKSYEASLLVIDFFHQHPDRQCILIDTEQAEWNVANVARRVCRGMGWDAREAYESKRLRIAHLRPYSKKDRLQIVGAIIEQEQPYLCIIDGIRDLVESINDDLLCSELIDRLMHWTDEYHNAIGVVIHTNKDGETLRGHLGSELLNKSETTIFCKAKVEENGGAHVSAFKPRNPAFSSFDLYVDQQGVPQRSEKIERRPAYHIGTEKEDAALNALPDIGKQAKEVWLTFIRTGGAKREGASLAEQTARKYFDDFVKAGYLVQDAPESNFYSHYKAAGLKEPRPITQTIDNSLGDDSGAPF